MTEIGGLEAGEAGVQKKPPLVLMLVCAFLSVVFIRLGFLSLFFLAPLGYAVLACNSVWLPFFSTAAVNSGCLIIIRLFSRNSPGSYGNMLPEILYFLTLFLGFAWIMGDGRLRTAYRFVLACAAGTLMFLVYINSPNSVFYAVLRDLAEMSASVFANPSVAEAGRSVPQQMMTPERVLEMVDFILLRGGALASTALMFFINRRVSLNAVSFVKRQGRDQGLAAFFAPSFTIWAMTGSLAVILLTRMFRVEILEIMAWNVFVICAIIFFAQGAGILMYVLARRASFAVRIFVSVLVVAAILSPVLNMFVIPAIIILGIVENWLPLRAPKQGPASTPGP